MNRFSIGNKYEYCPNGNHWYDISGIFDKEVFLYCNCKKCDGKVYALRAKDVTKKVDPEVIKKRKEWLKLEEVRSKINISNMEEVIKVLDK